MAKILLLTNSTSVEVLPSLSLLQHQVRIQPLISHALMSDSDVECLLIDARKDMQSAKSLVKFIEATGTDAVQRLVRRALQERGLGAGMGRPEHRLASQESVARFHGSLLERLEVHLHQAVAIGRVRHGARMSLVWRDRRERPIEGGAFQSARCSFCHDGRPSGRALRRLPDLAHPFAFADRPATERSARSAAAAACATSSSGPPR